MAKNKVAPFFSGHGVESVTLNDLERRNGHVVCVIAPNLLAFRTYCEKVV